MENFAELSWRKFKFRKLYTRNLLGVPGSASTNSSLLTQSLLKSENKLFDIV